MVLVGGTGPTDRDENVYGIPIFGQLANALADAGFMVAALRQARRRPERRPRRSRRRSPTYAEDVRAAIKMLRERKDVDRKRIAVVGHSEGGARGADRGGEGQAHRGRRPDRHDRGHRAPSIVLAQQQRLLDRMTIRPRRSRRRSTLQKKIQEAVITGKGWSSCRPTCGRQVDNAEFQSLLVSDPAKVMTDVRQPLLIVQGELDTQVAPSNADRLETLARRARTRRRRSRQGARRQPPARAGDDRRGRRVRRR